MKKILLKSKFIILLAFLITLSGQMAFAEGRNTDETRVTIDNKTDYKVELSVEQESTWGVKGARASRWTTLGEKPGPGQVLAGHWKDWASGTDKHNKAKLKIGNVEIPFQLKPNAPIINKTITIDRKNVEIEIKVTSYDIELVHDMATSIKQRFDPEAKAVTESFRNYEVSITQRKS